MAARGYEFKNPVRDYEKFRCVACAAPPGSIGMIRRLHDGLGIPAEVLILPYELEEV